MRPTILLCCALALTIGLSTAAHSQDVNRPRSPAQFPNPSAPQAANTQTSLRDGVITRAVAPGEDGQLRPPTTGGAHSRLNDSSPAFNDQAWTNQPQGPAYASAARSAESSMQERGQLPRTLDNRNLDNGAVVQAQFTTGETADASGRSVHPAAHNSGAGTNLSTTEPRPLKPPTENKPDGSHSTGTAQMFISVISSLAIVIGLLFGAAWCYRKASPALSGALPKTVVQVLGRTPLAPRQQLVLLRIGSKLVLVSNLAGEVRTISEINDPLEVDRLAGLCESAQPGSISESFRSVLHNIGRHEA